MIHRDEFSQREDFEEYRNMLGALVLLPKESTNHMEPIHIKRSLITIVERICWHSLYLTYAMKRTHHFEILSAQGLRFKPHSLFKKGDIEERQLLYKKICWRTG